MTTANAKPTKKTKPAEADAVRVKFQTARDVMKKTLIERDAEIDVALTALLCREHVLLVGPPGTAKSLLLDSLMSWFGGANKFSLLLTKFTTPEEAFGPFSVQALKQDVYRRVPAGKLPEAELAFLDEVFKASSAVLNTLLKILNERTFDPGDGVAVNCPLMLCLAASNEWPGGDDGGKELHALFDRFLFRKTVLPIRSRAGRARLLFGAADHTPKFPDTISRDEVAAAQAACARLPWAAGATDGMLAILEELHREGVRPGDRRTFKSRQAVRAAAWLDGSDRVEVRHLEVLGVTLWDDPQEQPDVCARVVLRHAAPVKLKAAELLRQAVSVADAVAGDRAKAIPAVPKLQAVQSDLAALCVGDPFAADAPDTPAGSAAKQVAEMLADTLRLVTGTGGPSKPLSHFAEKPRGN